ncbi:MAG TPA: hypothetical protein VMA37_12065 [Acetobacteraceae bacterium]|nr:hypothetical protein [Acetobacteraceae bacterium]
MDDAFGRVAAESISIDDRADITPDFPDRMSMTKGVWPSVEDNGTEPILE